MINIHQNKFFFPKKSQRIPVVSRFEHHYDYDKHQENLNKTIIKKIFLNNIKYISKNKRFFYNFKYLLHVLFIYIFAV